MTKKRFACFDADGTLFPGFVLPKVYSYMAEQGFIEQEPVDSINALGMAYANDEIPYEDCVKSVLDVAVTALAGKSEELARSHAEKFFAGFDDWYGYVRPTMSELGREQVETKLITAEPTFIARAIARRLGFNGMISTRFDTENGVFDGNVSRVMTNTNKGAYVKKLSLSGEVTYAFGDSDGDIAMLEACKYPYAIYPSDELCDYIDDNEDRGIIVINQPGYSESLIYWGQ